MSHGMDESPGLLNPAARYEELLRPYKDLAANWNVDIVAKLSEYLAELDIDINSLAPEEFTDGQVNFQHAALVIEGGTSVYSKKVDYLHQMVFAAADALREARGKSLLSRNPQSAPDECDDLECPASDDPPFLLLDDDSQPIREDITMPVRDPTDKCATLRACDANRLVSVPLHCLPRGRTSSANKNTVNLRGPEAKVNAVTAGFILDGIGVGDYGSPGLDSANYLPESGEAASVGTASEIDLDCANGSFSDDGGSSPVGDSANFTSQHEDAKASEPGGDQKLPNALAPTASSIAHPVSRRSKSDAVVPSNPFLPLDPQDANCLPSKPIRKGRTWRRPREQFHIAVTAEAKSKVSKSLMEAILGSNHLEFSRKSYRFVSFTAAENQFKQRMRTISLAKRRRRGTSNLYAADESDNDILANDNANDCVLNSVGDHVDGMLCNEDEDRDACLATGFFGADSDDDNLLDDPGNDDSFPEFEDLAAAFVDVGGKSHELFNASSERQIEQIAASYEESCRKYILETSIVWQAHAADTQLERRVSDWRSRIEPLLVMVEERGEFDIALYVDGILERFTARHQETNSREADMSSLFSASEPSEVCRNFLATLQLVNTYKIGIGPSSKEKVMDPVVSLLVTSHVNTECNDMSTSSKHSKATSPRHRRLALKKISENVAVTPQRRYQAGKRNRQAGSTPLSSQRATARSRLTGTPDK